MDDYFRAMFLATSWKKFSAGLFLLSFLALLSFQTLHQWLEHDHHHHHEHTSVPSEEAADDGCDLCKIKCVAYEPSGVLQLSFIARSAYAPKILSLTEKVVAAFPWERTARGP